MTLIMAWRELDQDLVWVASDSRLSAPGELAGRILLSDIAAKVLTVPVVLRYRIGDDMLGRVVQQETFILAFSGSSLVAMQVYAAVSAAWSQLITFNESRLPTIGTFAAHIKIFLKEYAVSVSGAFGKLQQCACILLGACPVSKKIEGWCLETIMADRQVDVAHRELDLSPGSIELFGSGKTKAETFLADVTCNNPMGWNREPLNMLRQRLRDGFAADVGGAVQIGYATPYGCFLAYDVQPVEDGVGVQAQFRGIEMSKIEALGNIFLGIHGLC